MDRGLGQGTPEEKLFYRLFREVRESLVGHNELFTSDDPAMQEKLDEEYYLLRRAHPDCDGKFEYGRAFKKLEKRARRYFQMDMMRRIAYLQKKGVGDDDGKPDHHIR